jgi:hypothetical protein
MLFSLIVLRAPRTNLFTALIDIDDTTLDLIVELFGFHAYWSMFTDGPDKRFWDIRISAVSNKEKYAWYICRDKTIGNFTVYSHNSRISLADVYEDCESYFNNFYFKQVKDFLQNRNEELLKFRIQQITHSTFASDKKISERKNFNVEDTFFRWKAQK